jgi:hypothetical protein
MGLVKEFEVGFLHNLVTGMPDVTPGNTHAE